MIKNLLSIALAAAFGTAIAAPAPLSTCGPTDTSIELAKHGADDPAGDDRGGRGRHVLTRVAKHGADDPAGDDRGGRGHRGARVVA